MSLFNQGTQTNQRRGAKLLIQPQTKLLAPPMWLRGMIDKPHKPRTLLNWSLTITAPQPPPTSSGPLKTASAQEDEEERTTQTASASETAMPSSLRILFPELQTFGTDTEDTESLDMVLASDGEEGTLGDVPTDE